MNSHNDVVFLENNMHRLTMFPMGDFRLAKFGTMLRIANAFFRSPASLSDVCFFIFKSVLKWSKMVVNAWIR